jgi:hypothetical protein
MSAGTFNFAAEQGATFNPVLTYKDSSGSLVNLTGYTARMQVRENFQAPRVLIDMTTENGGITLGGSAGTLALLVTATVMASLHVPNTGSSPPVATFYYDLELVNGSLVTRLMQGQFKVTGEVTR